MKGLIHILLVFTPFRGKLFPFSEKAIKAMVSGQTVKKIPKIQQLK